MQYIILVIVGSRYLLNPGHFYKYKKFIILIIIIKIFKQLYNLYIFKPITVSYYP